MMLLSLSGQSSCEIVAVACVAEDYARKIPFNSAVLTISPTMPDREIAVVNVIVDSENLALFVHFGGKRRVWVPFG